ncbi:MAG: GntR family transcriptional regulator, transcriptional repressor for pyruvate dehydrogenase complex [Thermosediminibacterales bacterium]|nr:GntR family transcriptional regulator, transcriptional repressor for pyruvate dehydrogenase complex [Thermosediminibacterales bacterium]
MKVEPIKRKTICDEIVDQFKQMIKNGELKPGEKLPSERELAKMFNVGRSSVGEALQVLSSIGLVKKTAEGSFINDSFSLNHLDFTYSLLLNENDYEQLYEARKVIETTIVELAAKKADVEDIYSLEEVLSDMSNKTVDIEEFARLDAEFHLNIALASKNKVLYEFVSTISDLLRTQVTEKLTRIIGTRKDIDIIQKTLQEHRNILEAIKNQNTKKAKECMYDHLNDAEIVFLKTKQYPINSKT